MRETTNYKLKKPDAIEFFDAENHANYNADVIDVAIKQAKDAADSKAPNTHKHTMSDITDFSPDASAVNYNNATSGLTSTKAQGAIDEVNAKAEANKTSISQLENNDGELANLQTTNKTNLVSAINEAFQYANSGKTTIATAVGSPLINTDTFGAMGTKIDTLTQTFKDNLMSKGISILETDKISNLIDKAENLSANHFPDWFPISNNLISAKNMINARSNVSSSIIDTKMYVVGGSMNGNGLSYNECYDTLTNTWVTKAPIPTTKFTCLSESIEGVMYVFGYGSDLYAYNPTTNTWTSKANYAYLSEQTSCVFNGNIYVFGGSDGNAPIYCYNPTTNTWTTKALMLTQRRLATCSASNSKAYVIGGYTTPGGVVTAMSTNECYDMLTNTWTTKSNFIDFVYSSPSECIEDNIYIFGGMGKNSSPLSNIYCYNITTDSWSIKRGIGRNRYGGASSKIGNNIYTTGGMSNHISTGALEYGTVNECYIV